MEGDAGASRLNPNEIDDSSSSAVTAEDSAESEEAADREITEVTAEDSAESEEAADREITESSAEELSDSASVENATETANDERGSSRLGRGWLIGITAVLLVLAGGVGTGGYFALRSNQESQAIARHDAEAVAAAKDCVAATQAPDVNAMAAGAQKIVDCSTGDFRAQAVLYSSLFVEAYQVGNVHVQVSDMRAAPERSNADGSVNVLVAFRIEVSNTGMQNREIGYRLRVKMAPDEGQYRIAKIDQVAT
jgi:Mce-associated membrane protein